MQSTTIVLSIGFFLLCFTTLKFDTRDNKTTIKNAGLLIQGCLLASSLYEANTIYDDNATQKVGDD